MRIHLISPFHTINSSAYSHCAFTGKALRFSTMIQSLNHEVIEYGNEGSESDAKEHVVMLNKNEFSKAYPPLGETEQHARDAVYGTAPWIVFNMRLTAALQARVKPDDIIAHPFGRAHMGLVQLFPAPIIHLETGVGYPDAPFGAWRVFESEAWRHYHWGRYENEIPIQGDNGLNHFYSWVIPNYYDVTEWPVGWGGADYALFMGRIDACKGIYTIVDLIRAWQKLHPDDPLKFVFAGQGNFDVIRTALDPSLHNRIEYRGTVLGRDRAALTGNARCMLMPTNYVEPFGGAGVEGMLTGTPLIASDWGAFTETVQHGNNGFRCKTLNDWVVALEQVKDLSRLQISVDARDRYSYSACAKLYDRAFSQLDELRNVGWHTLRSRA